MSFFHRFRRLSGRRRGAPVPEYVLLLGGIAVVALFALAISGERTRDLFRTDQLPTAGETPPGGGSPSGAFSLAWTPESVSLVLAAGDPVPVQVVARLTNLGVGPAPAGVPVLDGGGGAWTVVEGCAGPLVPGEGCDLTLRYAPSGPGASSAVVRRTGAPDLPVSGQRLPAALLAWDPVPEMESAALPGPWTPAVLRNLGGAPSAPLAGLFTAGAGFEVRDGTCVGPLAPGASCAAEVRLAAAPTGFGPRSGILATAAENAPEAPLSGFRICGVAPSIWGGPDQTADFVNGGSYVMRIVPANCTRAEILAWGAGGAAGRSTEPLSSGHGGGGSLARGLFAVVAGEQIRFRVGAGGAGAISATGSGFIISRAGGGQSTVVWRGSGTTATALQSLLSSGDLLLVAAGGGGGGGSVVPFGFVGGDGGGGDRPGGLGTGPEGEFAGPGGAGTAPEAPGAAGIGNRAAPLGSGCYLNESLMDGQPGRSVSAVMNQGIGGMGGDARPNLVVGGNGGDGISGGGGGGAGAQVADLTTSPACVSLGAGGGGGGGGASWIAPSALSGAVEPGQSILVGGDGSTWHAAGRGRGGNRALPNVADVSPAGSPGRLVILWR